MYQEGLKMIYYESRFIKIEQIQFWRMQRVFWKWKKSWGCALSILNL